MNEPPTLSDAQLEKAARVFAALGEPSRLRLLKLLMEHPGLSVGELVGHSGFGQANVSKHLGILYQAGLVARDRQGTRVIYGLKGSFCENLCAMVCGEILRDARLLSEP